ncbi:MAG: polysaccharide deacetylase family protein [Polyangiaceae bacterium]
MAVHVSIHDVSPAWEDEVDAALEACAKVGAKPALLVVPNFHGKSSLADHPQFAEKLARLQQDGHEIFLHGFFHRSGLGGPQARSDAGKVQAFFRQKVVSAGEAEFADVSKSEAEKRLDDGVKMLADAGLTPDGFIAPAWSFPRWLLPLLAARNLSFTEDHTHVYDPVRKKKRASLVLNFASRTPARLLSSVAWARLAKPARLLLPTRIAIHPGDMHVRLLRHEVRSLLAWAEGDFVRRGQELFA